MNEHSELLISLVRLLVNTTVDHYYDCHEHGVDTTAKQALDWIISCSELNKDLFNYDIVLKAVQDEVDEILHVAD